MVSLAEATRIKNKYSKQLLRRPGVWGVGVERDQNGEPVLVVHTDARHRHLLGDLPAAFEKCPVRVVEDAPFTKQEPNRPE